MHKKRNQVSDHRRDPEKAEKAHGPVGNPLHQDFNYRYSIALLLPENKGQPKYGGKGKD